MQNAWHHNTDTAGAKSEGMNHVELKHLKV